MALVAGTQLGPYEIIAAVGAGGMGEVYSAKDSKLGREVAIKVLPEAFSQDPERLARFQREARLLASLNHQNIATIHGLEESGGTHYLVMELVPGETLAERIKRDGVVPVEESLGIATQIAEALEHAHEHGIIHRDLKPANVKVTPDGQVKVLDFGLAKAFSADGSDSASTFDSNSPTVLTGSPTMPGVILGTAAYMSPEQAKGKAVDKRTDIWAFGCVLFELLTGKMVFAGETVTDILGAVLHKEPEWSVLPDNIRPGIRALLRRCLQKEARHRLRDAGDLRIQIEDSLTAPPAQVDVAAPPLPVWRRALPVGMVGLIVGAIITGIAVWNVSTSVGPGSRMNASQLAHLQIALPPGQRLTRLIESSVVVSPDGTQIIYVAGDEGDRQLYRRAIDSVEAVPISGTQGASTPFFSPDGEWVGFFADGKLKKISILGGPPISIADSPDTNGGAWGPEDMIIFSPGPSALMKVSASGGTPERLTTLDSGMGEDSHRYPEFLPGGKAVLFLVYRDASTASSIEVISLETGERRVLVEGAYHGRYAPTGHLVYSQGATLMAAPFDPERLEITGSPAPVFEGVMSSIRGGVAQFSLSQVGTMVYVPGGIREDARSLAWVDLYVVR